MENSLLLMKGVENGFYVSEEIMNKLYLRQKEEMDGVCLITPQILKDVRAICKVINEDYCFTNHKRILNFSLIKLKSLQPFQRIFFEKFVEAAQFCRHKFRMNIDDRIVNHFSVIMMIFPVIIQYIEDDDVRVFELLKQIAIAHADMQVQTSHLKLFFVSLTNILIHGEFISRDHLEPIIIFFMTIANYMINYLDSYCRCPHKDDGVDRYMSRYRKNYRMLKRYHTLMDEINEKVIFYDKRRKVKSMSNKIGSEEESYSESLETMAKRTCLFGWCYRDSKD
ncbi:uncharacterized protein LOC109596712 isoform X2 [Aethina tumida]|nr:uncharacterized protein LOC109596712 isoform X2 [Aethina tumida]